MGLFTGLLTLPLAPVRGVTWIAEQLRQEALRELYDPTVIHQRLEEVADAREAGELSDEEAAELERELVGRLMQGAQSAGGLEV
ncbi:gas vesicle protein GvpG [Streptomyces sp. ME19-01-6]|uniref:gas vesicle protein GvpG n=1 Tax=Streptomyces sp. ME19-01-6 TaxID=3028686 RepID=UPI0029B02CA6|nr:gas vesicle protein GvpG [Streptomyces sp. ME19-01-6]MDX3233100.1 gas vesicle protein GvpG [Streptomyces sp. ME19-01-6]